MQDSSLWSQWCPCYRGFTVHVSKTQRSLCVHTQSTPFGPNDVTAVDRWLLTEVVSSVCRHCRVDTSAAVGLSLELPFFTSPSDVIAWAG